MKTAFFAPKMKERVHTHTFRFAQKQDNLRRDTGTRAFGNLRRVPRVRKPRDSRSRRRQSGKTAAVEPERSNERVAMSLQIYQTTASWSGMKYRGVRPGGRWWASRAEKW